MVMPFRIQLIAVADDGTEHHHEIAALIRTEATIETTMHDDPLVRRLERCDDGSAIRRSASRRSAGSGIGSASRGTERSAASMTVSPAGMARRPVGSIASVRPGVEGDLADR
jgi:hypothetical protein